ncbi:DUF945 domain-containing protein [Crossiella sp. SN42]|uniref:DUF932 domain-containing protein n=1 Tax=Crossiella sp. SN42 TaxID=2944808 RepID=UPI00207D5127|nr:DUF932 domain-containing protein [Crossiella sp. SN42]MCO1575609.1 DUF945 domain-containing protein [Crossiella sp. SN42]
MAPPRAPLDPRRTDPWTRLGTDVRHARSAQEALEMAGLANWNIRPLPMFSFQRSNDQVLNLRNPEHVMLVRDNHAGEPQYLSTVGRKYGILQNEDQAAVLDVLLSETGASSLTAAGSFDQGRRTFVTMRLPEQVNVGGVDLIDQYLVASSSHDGTAKFRMMITPVRVVCCNQLGVALARQTAEVSIRHNTHAAVDPIEIQSQLRILRGHATSFHRQAERLLDATLTDTQFRDLIAAVWPDNNDGISPRAKQNLEKRNSGLTLLWSTARTQQNIRNTGWAAFNVIAEYLDHLAPARSAIDRAYRTLTSTSISRKKQLAYDLLTHRAS